MRRIVVLFAVFVASVPVVAQRPAISSTPDTPFKLATFEATGRTRVGLVLGSRVIDIPGANAAIVRDAGLAPMPVPTDMRALIEEYSRVSARLYQIANYFRDAKPDSHVA